MKFTTAGLADYRWKHIHGRIQVKEKFLCRLRSKLKHGGFAVIRRWRNFIKEYTVLTRISVLDSSSCLSYFCEQVVVLSDSQVSLLLLAFHQQNPYVEFCPASTHL